MSRGTVPRMTDTARPEPLMTDPRLTRNPDPAPVEECDDCLWEPGGELCAFHSDAARSAVPSPP